jgi:transcription elongation factor Elf1
MGMKDHRYDDDDDDLKPVKAGQVRFTEFECPGCNANNPTEAFGHKANVLCNYCGMEWEARIDDEGKLELVEA